MKRVVLLCAAFAWLSVPAAAQVVEEGFVGGVLGVTAAGQGSVLVGGEAEGRVTTNMNLFVELGWVANLPTAVRDVSAATIAGALAQKTGQTVAFDASTPTLYGGVGVRYFVFPVRGLRPYVEGSVGFARQKQDVAFSVGGTDVSARLSDFGVTLGSDLAGSATAATTGIGGGIRVPHGSWHFDGGYRYTRIYTEREGTNANRVHVIIGYRF